MDNVLMVPDQSSPVGLRPAKPGEESMAVARWPVSKAISLFANGGGASPCEPYTGFGPGPCGAPAGYMDPGSKGACAPRGRGVGFFGAHTNNTGTTTATSTSVSPERPVRITQFAAYGENLHIWALNVLRINQDVLKHGANAPLSIFDPQARYPVEFDLALGTQDTVTLATVKHRAGTENHVAVAGANCYSSARGLDYPCAPIGADGSRQIILGLGTAAPTENAGTATLSDTPDTPIRLGRLCLDAVFNGTGPDAAPEAGLTAGNEVRGLEFIIVTAINVNSVTIFTTVPTNGAIPGGAFHPRAGGVFFPDVLVNQADTINVAITNRVAAHAGTGANTITVCGAFVGCEIA